MCTRVRFFSLLAVWKSVTTLYIISCEGELSTRIAQEYLGWEGPRNQAKFVQHMTYDCTPSNSHEGPTKCSPTWSRGTALWLAVIILHTAPNTLSTIRLFLRDCATVKRDRRISGYLLHTRREWEKQRLYSFQGLCLTVATSIQTGKQGDSVSVGQQCTHSYDFIDQIWCNYKSRSYIIPTSANDWLQYEIVEKLGS